MKIGFHGTSLQAAQSILKEGWKVPPNSSNWTLSTGNPYVLTDVDSDNWNFCFEEAISQSSSKALKEVLPNKRAVIAFNLGSKPLKKDYNHHADYAYEVDGGFCSDDIEAIWCDDWDISEFRIFADFRMKNHSVFIPDYSNRTPIQLAILKSLKSYSMEEVCIPIKEIYRKNSGKFVWSPSEFEYSI
jgi:hypothetical protein